MSQLTCMGSASQVPFLWDFGKKVLTRWDVYVSLGVGLPKNVSIQNFLSAGQEEMYMYF